MPATAVPPPTPPPPVYPDSDAASTDPSFVHAHPSGSCVGGNADNKSDIVAYDYSKNNIVADVMSAGSFSTTSSDASSNSPPVAVGELGPN
ncbi:hypothetical protein ACP70R_009313 [Stipagrostis hirtigluma subsp. patula]